MRTIRKSSDRGSTSLGWLESKHTFSFGDYYDPSHHQYRTLRVINDDIVAPGGGFGMHPHRDMEIFTYVLTGSLEHKDSLGHGSVIKAGDWQAMTAGTGLLHSEFNPSKTQSVHLLQMWIMPNKKGLLPSYAQQSFADTPPNVWRVGLSPDGREGSMMIHQDAVVMHARLEADQVLDYPIQTQRALWLQVATGSVNADGLVLNAGDGLAVEAEDVLRLTGKTTAELVLFDLA